MTAEKDYLGEKLRLLERAREDVFFRHREQAAMTQWSPQTILEEDQGSASYVNVDVVLSKPWLQDFYETLLMRATIHHD